MVMHHLVLTKMVDQVVVVEVDQVVQVPLIMELHLVETLLL